MITNFLTFLNEKLDISNVEVSGKLPQNLIDKLTSGLSLIYSKKKKRNLRISSINYEEIDKNYNYDKTFENSLITIKLSNKDIIEGSLKITHQKTEHQSSEITIIINDKKVYDLEFESLKNTENLVDSIIREYKKILEKTWKIKSDSI